MTSLRQRMIEDMQVRNLSRSTGPINDLVDEAYRARYHGSPYLSMMIAARARSATVKVTPRETKQNVNRG